MRILYLYNDYFGRRKNYGKIMSRLGHKVIFHEIRDKSKSGSISVKMIKKYNPDILWMYSPFYASSNKKAMKYCSEKGIKKVLFSTINVHIPYEEWLWVWKRIDFLFMHHKPCTEYLRSKGLNAFYMPLGFYPSMYSKLSMKKNIDVSFCGRPQSAVRRAKDKRSKYLQSLKNKNIVVYGKDFKSRLSGIPVKSYRGHNIERKVFAKTKVNLDLPFINSSSPFYKHMYHFKNRFFEIPATGNFMLTCRHDDFLEIFGEDSVGYYDDNIESLKESVSRYLKDKKIREKMAKKAYQIVHEKHTFYHRFKDMFKILKDYL